MNAPRRPLRIWIVIFGLVVTLPVHAAEIVEPPSKYSWTLWTEENGLSSREVWAIVQDASGYLWLGTTKGLVRFDGVNFMSWAGRGSTTLPPRPVDALVVARDGSLWVGLGGEGGVSRIHPDGQVVNYTTAHNVPDGFVTTMIEARDGAIWVGTWRGLAKFSEGRWQAILPMGEPSGFVQALFQDRQGVLWVGTSAGVFFSRGGTRTLELYARDLDYVQDFAEDATGRLWISHPSTGARLLSPIDAKAPTDLHANGRNLLRDSDGALWIGTTASGVFRMDEHGLNPVPVGRSEQGNAVSGEVRALFEDHDGNIWIGTRRGLLRLRESSVMTFTRNNGLSNDMVRSVESTRDGSVWVATANGVNRISPDRGFAVRQELLGQEVLSLHEDVAGVLWVATDQGIGRFVNGKFVIAIPSLGALDRVTVITSDANGLWLCEEGRGLLLWNHGKLTTFHSVKAVGGRSCVSAHADAEQRVWFGFQNGDVVAYHNGEFRSYHQSDGLAGGTVIAIYVDRADDIWVGSANGLSRFRDGRFAAITAQRGLPADRVSAIVEDATGDLWLALSSGIVRLERAELDRALADPAYRLRYSAFDTSDGLRGVPAWWFSPTAVRSRDGRLWFLVSDGVATVDPGHLRKSGRPVPVYIETIVVNGQTVAPQPNVVLSPATSKVQIGYLSADVSSASKVHFRYMLRGFDSDWIYPGMAREATYTNLPARAYRFRVSASSDGNWTGPESVWDFSVKARWYQTIWFFAIALTGLAALFSGAWWVRIAGVKRQFNVVLAERIRLSREIHDTLLQSLVGVVLKLQAVSNELPSDSGPANETIRRIRKEVEHYIREARESIAELRSSASKIRDLAAAFLEAAEHIIPNGQAHLDVVVSGDDPTCSAVVTEQLYRIGQEAMRNAVVHGSPTHIRVELIYDHKTVTLHVSDDGIGFDPHEEHNRAGDHWGLIGMQERAERVGGELRIESSPGKGTKIEVVVPRRLRSAMW